MSSDNLQELFSDGESLGVMLSTSREEMYKALELFHNHVKHTLSLMFTILTAVLAIFSFTIKEGVISTDYFFYVMLLGSALLALLFPLSLLSSRITNRYYRLYVSSLFFSAKLHESIGLLHHPWFYSLKDVLRETAGDKIDEIIDERTNGKAHSCFLYSMLIKSIGIVGLALGFTLFISFLVLIMK
ncbi:MAG: hypothetical protein R3F02_05080 [Thiolinea sp.]